MLKAILPENVKPKKPKFIVSGKSGVGKTIFALGFPRPYIIDTEGGATRPEYVDKMKAVRAGYMGKEQGSQDFKTVVDQVKELATTKHDYETLVIDSFSKLYNLEAAKAEEVVGSDYGRDRKEANKPTKQLMRWMESCDMTILLVCHQKDKWEKVGEKREQTGTTFDAWDKMEYDLDLWIEAQLIGRSRNFVVKKSRIKDFVVGNSFPLDYESFSKLYGKDVIEKEATQVTLATPDQIARLQGLIELFHIPMDEQSRWLKKFEADGLGDLDTDQIQQIINYLEKKLPPPSKGATK